MTASLCFPSSTLIPRIQLVLDLTFMNDGAVDALKLHTTYIEVMGNVRAVSPTSCRWIQFERKHTEF